MSAYLVCHAQRRLALAAAADTVGGFLSAGNTACFAGIIATQIANVFACRSPSVSITTLGFGSNPLVLVGIGIELALAAFIIYTPAGNSSFDCAPIGADVWLLLLPFALLLLALDESRKIIVRRARNGSRSVAG